MEDFLYQRNLYQPLIGKAKKPKTVSNMDWEVLNRKALRMIKLSLSSSIAFNVFKEKIIEDLMTALEWMYKKPSVSNKVLLMKTLFHLKMAKRRTVVENLNKFNFIISQLTLASIKFNDKVGTLLILSSLSKS